MTSMDLPRDKAMTPSPRSTRRGLARRDQILETAKSLFLEHGFAGVAIDDVVKVVGGSKTNVYSQFGSKEGLFVGAVDALCADFLGDFQRVRLTGKNVRTGLMALSRALLATLLHERHIAFQRLVFAESGRFPALGPAWFGAGPSASRRVIADFIAAKQRDGALRSVDPGNAATLLHDMVVTNPLYLALIGTPMDASAVERHLRGAVDVFLAGTTPR